MDISCGPRLLIYFLGRNSDLLHITSRSIPLSISEVLSLQQFIIHRSVVSFIIYIHYLMILRNNCKHIAHIIYVYFSSFFVYNRIIYAA